MFSKREVEIKVGLFVIAGVTLLMLGILTLGAQSSMFMLKNIYYAHFPAVDGLIPGAKVMIGGIQVGTVEEVDFDNTARDVQVTLKVGRKYAQWVHKDSTIELATQGVLGDRYVIVNSGTGTEPSLENGANIPSKSTQNMAEFLSKGDQLIARLTSISASLDGILKAWTFNNRHEALFQGLAQTSKNMALATDKLNQEVQNIQLKSTVGHLNGILGKIDSGVGTLGALVNDPSLYDEAKSLMGGANRNRIVRNLVRQTIKDNMKKEQDSQQ